MNKITLKEILDKKITSEDFLKVDEDAHSIVKITVVATHLEHAYGFLHIMMEDTRKQYTLDLFEKIEETPWYDFNLEQQQRFILVWQLESVADQEELVEYFTECLQEFNQDFGDIITEIVERDQLDQLTKVYTHDQKVLVSA